MGDPAERWRLCYLLDKASSSRHQFLSKAIEEAAASSCKAHLHLLSLLSTVLFLSLLHNHTVINKTDALRVCDGNGQTHKSRERTGAITDPVLS